MFRTALPILLSAVLLGCPYLCLGGGCGCTDVSALDCCANTCPSGDDCHEEDVPPEPSDSEECPFDCVCKGAVTPAGPEVGATPVYPAESADFAPCDRAPSRHVVPTASPPGDESGRGLRLRIDSLVC